MYRLLLLLLVGASVMFLSPSVVPVFAQVDNTVAFATNCEELAKNIRLLEKSRLDVQTTANVLLEEYSSLLSERYHYVDVKNNVNAYNTSMANSDELLNENRVELSQKAEEDALTYYRKALSLLSDSDKKLIPDFIGVFDRSGRDYIMIQVGNFSQHKMDDIQKMKDEVLRQLDEIQKVINKVREDLDRLSLEYKQNCNLA